MPRARSSSATVTRTANNIRHALLGNLMGHKVYIVVEKALPSWRWCWTSRLASTSSPTSGVRARLLHRLRHVGIERRRHVQVRPPRLPDPGAGGASAQPRQAGLPATAALPPGPQIANIRDIQGGIRECGRFYAELCRLGANVEVVDVGGGPAWTMRAPAPEPPFRQPASPEYANNVVGA